MSSKDMSGVRLGQYELRDRLGRGGMAEVYRAYQPGMDRFVAVKLMLGHLADDDTFVERFRREAQAVGKLRHPHIVNVFDFGIQDDVYYMVMEYLRGGNLKQRISAVGRLPLTEALRIGGQLADALNYAHEAGMIHRDLKPANIMFGAPEASDAILTDFGIARILTESGLTNSGMMVGTPAYMSPEAGHGLPADERADIYALGIILYEMVTGTVPYSADTPLAIVMKHINAPLPSLSEYQLPEAVELIIMKAMAKRPEERFQTAADLKADIDRALPLVKDYQPPAPTPATPPARPVVQDGLTQIPPVEASRVPPAPAAIDATNALPAPVKEPTKENSPTPSGIPAPKASEGDTADTGKPLPSEFPFPRYMLAGAIVAVVIVLGIGLLVIGGDDGNSADNTTSGDAATLGLTSLVERQETATAFIGSLTQPADSSDDDSPALTEIAQTLESATQAIDLQASRIAELETEQAATDEPEPTDEPDPTDAPEPTDEPDPTDAPAPTDEPDPTDQPDPTDAPAPTDEPAPTEIADLPDVSAPSAFVIEGIDLLTGAFPLLDQVDAELLQGDGELALQRLNVRLADDPDDVDALIARSLYNGQQFNYAGALSDAERAVELAPDNPYSQIALADAYYEQNNIEAALAALDAAAAIAPDNPEVQWRMGRIAYAYGDVHGAQATIEAAIENGARGFRFAYHVGTFFEEIEEAERAIPYLVASVEVFPFDEWLFYQAARAFFAIDEPMVAFERAQERLESRTLDPVTTANYAYIAYAAGQYEVAEQWALDAEARQEIDLVETAYIIALIYDAQNSPEATARFEALRELGQTQVAPFLNLALEHDARIDYARHLQRIGELDTASQVMSAVTTEDLSWYMPAHRLLGEIEAERGNDMAAYEAFLRAFATVSNYPEQLDDRNDTRQRVVDARFRDLSVDVSHAEPDFQYEADASSISFVENISDIHDDVEMLAVFEGEREAALRYLNVILDENPDDSEALSALALYYIEVEDNPDAALEHIERLEAIDPENLGTYIARWHHSHHYNVNDFEAAAKALEAGLALFPAHPFLLWRMSITQAQLQNYGTAETFEQEALAQPGNGYRYAAWLGPIAADDGDYRMAADAYLVAYLADPGNTFFAEQLLAALVALEDSDGAMRAISTMEALADSSPTLYSALAYAMLDLAQPEAALAYAQSAVALTRNDHNALYVYALVIGDGFAEYDRALEVLAQTDFGAGTYYDHVFLNPERGHTLPYDMARFMVKVDDSLAALEILNEGMVAYPEFVAYYLLAAEINVELGEVDAARDILTGALDLFPEESAAYTALQAMLADIEGVTPSEENTAETEAS